MSTQDEDASIFPDWKKVLVNRQEFLKLASLISGGVIALVAVIPSITFFFGYFFRTKDERWINLGSIDDFVEGETKSVVFENPFALQTDGVSARRTAWLRRESADRFLAFAVNCTHLGCPVRWEQGADLFLCPCHGGVYYANGDVAAGPPPRPMHQYTVRVQRGQVEILMRPILTEL